MTFIPRIEFGDNVTLNDNIHIGCARSVTIGNNVLMASNIFISDHNHGKYSGTNQDSPLTPPEHRDLDVSDVFIGNNVWIGESASILPGVIIGEGCIVGANSVVTKDIPKFCIVAGNPARILKYYDEKSRVWRRADDR
ncbi:DapH/DapD/GlmU-related protein [Deinococcus detaillensis]|nr:DapH/DapD/GlmU-related protein [Deinococcus detaillensis]